MRVIAGMYRSRPLRTLPGVKTRPTSDRMRETLFNVLNGGDPQALEGSVWIDVFAGTGAVGIEALSRGAQQVTFIDNARNATGVIGENLKALGIRRGFEIVDAEAGRALRQLAAKEMMADYVFLDPPYAEQDLYAEALTVLGASKILKPTSIVIAEHDKRFDPGESFGTLQRYRTLLSGDSGLSFYRTIT